MPDKISTGKVMNEPPPAREFCKPAQSPATTTNAISMKLPYRRYSYKRTPPNQCRTAKINRAQLFSTEIPLPDLTTQRAIVAEIEAEQALVTANRELNRRMEAKVKAAIDRVWGDAS